MAPNYISNGLLRYKRNLLLAWIFFGYAKKNRNFLWVDKL